MTESLVYKARLAEQLEMYTEMKDTMRELVELKHKELQDAKGEDGSVDETAYDLTEDERNLLSVAYKNVVGQRRTAWRIVCSLENKNDEPWKGTICKDFRAQIEKELVGLCNEIIEILEKCLLPAQGTMPEQSHQQETTVFFYKMKGDYLRYLVEVSRGEDRDQKSEQAKAAYNWAYEVAANLKPTHPIRLGLALNFSVYHYEIACQPQDACELAKKAFDDAIAELDSASEETYKDSTLILQLLRDNLSLWTTEQEQDGVEQD